MTSCKDCKYWGSGRAEIIGFAPGAKKQCARFNYDNNRLGSNAFLENGDFASSSASLWTEPEFGCASGEVTK